MTREQLKEGKLVEHYLEPLDENKRFLENFLQIGANNYSSYSAYLTISMDEAPVEENIYLGKFLNKQEVDEFATKVLISVEKKIKEWEDKLDKI